MRGRVLWFLGAMQVLLSTAIFENFIESVYLNRLKNKAMVLTNRVMNIVRLNKADRHSLDQLHLAKTVVTCAIKAAIDAGRPKQASRIAHTVLRLARDRDGINLSHWHGISLVDCIPLGRGLPAEFERYTVANLTSQVEQKLAARRQRDAERSSLTP